MKTLMITLFLISGCTYPKRMVNSFYNSSSNVHNGYVLEFYEESGKLRQVTPYKKGVKSGTGYVFYESGDIMRMGKYKKDKREGEWKAYDPNGVVTSKVFFIADSAISVGSYNPAHW